MEYITSSSEISRRKKAYIALVVSFITGMFLTSLIINFPLSIIVYLCFAAAFLLLGFMAFRSFTLLSRLKLQLTDQELIKISDGVSEKFPLSNVTKVNIKNTSRGAVRELRIRFNDGKSTFINGLDDAGRFIDDFSGKIGKEAVVSTIREPVDFDHVVFYPVLGLLLGAGSVFTVKVLANYDPRDLKSVYIAFSVYVLGLALYIIFARPVASRQGGKSGVTDYVLGAVFIFAAALVGIVGFLGNI
jgi:hypothetical protein